MPALLGIDIGSTALKAGVYDQAGGELAVARIEYRKPAQRPDDSWRATLRAVRQVLRRRPELASQIEGIGLSGRGGTRVFLDRGARPLPVPGTGSPSPAAVSRAIEVAGSRRGMHGIRFLAAIVDLRSTLPSEFARVARAMVAKDYVIFQLTGHAVTDPASSIDRESWPPSVLNAPELQGVRLSEVRWPWQEAGRLREPVARQIGLRAGIPVATGAHDGAAATVGAGAAHTGAHAVTLGTNTVYRIITDRNHDGANRFWTVLPGLTAFGADVTLGGYAVDWITRLLAAPHDRLAHDAARLPPGSEGVVFLPQMAGRILPEPDPRATASFSGIRRNTTRAHLYRAVLEGNAFALRAAREALLAQGLPEGDIYLTGRGTQGPLWRQVLADVFGRPVAWAGVEEGCRGAATFAAVAAGVSPDVWTAARAMTGSPNHCRPSDRANEYQAAYEHYAKVRGALDRV